MCVDLCVGKKKRRAAAAARQQRGDGPMAVDADGSGAWSTGPIGDGAPVADGAEENVDDMVVGDGPGIREAVPLQHSGRKKIGKRGNRTRKQKQRKLKGVEKALAVAERVHTKAKKIVTSVEKKKSVKNLWMDGD